LEPHPPPELRALASARIALGALFLIRTTPILAPLHLRELRGTLPLLGWPDGLWHGSPTLPLPAPAFLVPALCIVRTAAALAFTLGVRVRVAGVIAGVAGYLVLLQQPFAFIMTLHLLFQATILLALTECANTMALRPRPARDPGSGLTMIRLFVASVYLWAGIGKLSADWLDGHKLEVLAQQRWLSGRLADLLLATPDRRAAVAWAVVMGELALGPMLLWPRTRRAGLVAALAFHAGLQLMARPDLLGFEMAALLICFLPRALTGAGSVARPPATR